MASTFYKQGKEALRLLKELLFPRACCHCGKRLMVDEEVLCSTCMQKLPFTHLKGEKSNIVERLLWDHLITTERGNSLLYYSKENFHSIYYAFKYHQCPDVAVFFGKLMAKDLTDTSFFEGIDVMLPVPLSPQKMRQRGYNQSERLAEGVRQVTGIPVDTQSVVRNTHTSTQTQVISIYEREENVKEIFSVIHPECLTGKHLLLIDDVLTTGSTIRSLAHAILKNVPEIKLSVLTLGLSHFHRHPLLPPYVEPQEEYITLKKTKHRKGLPF